MRILLVEPFFAGSHRAWAEGYRRHSAHEVSLVLHPGANWRWRMRGGSVTLAAAVEAWVAAHGRPDLVLVSSPLDVAALAGLTRRCLADVPIVAYLHENQVTYPHPDAADLDLAWRTWTSLVAADHAMVNSRHHLEELADGLRRLVGQAPDQPHTHLLDAVLDGIEVIPVGVDLPESARRTGGRPPRVMWNHRWDADKNPEVFVRAIERLRADGLAVEVILGGADHWDGGRRRAEAAERLGDTVVAVGPFDDDTYRRHLASADIVVSVAHHDYFGVAIVEAVAAGCVPVLPRRLAYPELIPERFHGVVFHGDGGFRRRLAEVVADLDGARAAIEGLAEAMHVFAWHRVAPLLDDALTRVAHRG